MSDSSLREHIGVALGCAVWKIFTLPPTYRQCDKLKPELGHLGLRRGSIPNIFLFVFLPPQSTRFLRTLVRIHPTLGTSELSFIFCLLLLSIYGYFDTHLVDIGSFAVRLGYPTGTTLASLGPRKDYISLLQRGNTPQHRRAGPWRDVRDVGMARVQLTRLLQRRSRFGIKRNYGPATID
ncbi:hypothetical protein B0H14DRAFT_3584751 [Mycena olivaceomarginata]|nr:hypothetical protein B0H14DRAFT_3584751 [Mycena olivaceomarginata]